MSWLDAARKRLAVRRGSHDEEAGSDQARPPAASGPAAGEPGPADSAPAAAGATPAKPRGAVGQDGGAAGAAPSGTGSVTPGRPGPAGTADASGMTTRAEVGGGTDTRPGLQPAAAAPPAAAPRPERPWPEQVGILTWVRLGFFVALGVLAAIGLTNAARAASGILVQALIAAFLAVSLDPLVRGLNRRGLPRPLAVIVILTSFIAALSLFVLSVTPPLVDQLDEFVDAVPEYVDNLQRESRRFQDLNERFQITDRLQDFLATAPANIARNLVNWVGRVLGAAFGTLLVIVLTIYFLLDLPRLRRGAPRLMPMHNRAGFEGIVDIVVDKVGAYMIGQFTISLIAGFSAFVALTVLGAAAPLPLAVVVAVTAIIPLIGATLGAIVSVGITALTNEVWPTAVILLLFFIVYQQVENYFIAPRVQRSAVDLSAPAVLLAGIIGGAIQGLLGALMAIPLAAAIKVVIVQRIEAHEKTERVAREGVPIRRRRGRSPGA